MKGRVFYTLVFVFMGSMLLGQTINPPPLKCTTVLPSGEVELTWQQPANSCGPFQNYEIYYATNIAGPYTLLTTIPNITTTTFTHTGINASTTTYYYYIVGNYNCPGFTNTTSDTLDTQEPVAPDIQYVTVLNNNVELNWDPFISPETFAWIIYRYDGGFIPIDTVFNKFATSFTDFYASPGTGAETYTIAAMDSCGNTGPFFNIPHTTIYLEHAIQNCATEISLSWSEYEGWSNVAQYEVFVSANSGPFQSAGITTATNPNLIFTNFNDGDNLCFYVEAEHPTEPWRSRSNEVCLTVNITEPIDYLYLLNATVTANNDVLVEWLPDNNADIFFFDVFFGTSELNVVSAGKQGPPPPFEFTDTKAEPASRPYYYQVEATDSCQQTISTGFAKTIHLEATPAPEYINQLRWNEYEIDNGTVQEYHVYRDDNGTWTQAAILPATQTSFDDNLSDQLNSSGGFCYRVDAVVELNFPDGSTHYRTSSSNVSCAAQFPVIFVPTAFAPEGQNNFFRPMITFAVQEDYLMQVFNRWGQKVFETRDLNTAWDGRFDGEIVPQGVYTYIIRVKGENGSLNEEKGTVMVLR